MIQIALIQRSEVPAGPDVKLLLVYNSCYRWNRRAASPFVYECFAFACVRERGVIEGGDAGCIHATFILTEKAQTSSMLSLL